MGKVNIDPSLMLIGAIASPATLSGSHRRRGRRRHQHRSCSAAQA